MITESVVIMKKLLQMHPAQYVIIKHLAKLIENIQVPMAPEPASCGSWLHAMVTGYQELPDCPEEAPDPSMHNLEVPEWTARSNQ
ncbi:hypothetical protein MJG53_013888 [Ovis ammon polii x Ovis aries]|uniref:Uncharacterized protein n=1 Tax=Ovis ammon polii x Ovis aries TaxID=2918886 RepID=A0ACB9UK79_9CETA|nr:hypothetical protein MJG53_013888 [Ovis ammon polii x Ovis aries]